MKKQFNIATIIGIMILVAAVTFTITFILVENSFADQLSGEKQRNTRIDKLVQIMDIIDNHYVGEYEADDLIDGAAAGMVAGTGDRWSFYLTKEEYEEYKLSLNNEHVGIGVTVVYDSENGELVVAKVHSGSPSDLAGLKKNDRIISVEGVSVAELGYSESLARVRGVENTSVMLGVRPQGEEDAHEVEVMRRYYQLNPVSSKIIDGNIGYIKIDNFDSRVDINFADSVNSLITAGVEGFVFDVRDNGGGMKDVMVSMLDLLCPEGVLFTMQNKKGEKSVDYSDAEELDYPMTVIINENSYSAAEFFAAALQEYGKAQVIGTNTSGKGYSQVTRELSDGSAMNISTNEYFTPNGKSLIGVGVEPDHYVELGYSGSFLLLEQEQDVQLQKALEVLETEIITRRAMQAEG